MNFKLLPLALVIIGLTGCANAVHVYDYGESKKGAIKADGDISGIIQTGTFSRKERILHIEIFPRELSEVKLQDIWVEFPPTNRIVLADLTEDKIKSYSVDHCTFQFEENKLVKFETDVYGYGYPTLKKGNMVRLGSLKNNSSLILPCSIKDYEMVFGKPDDIERMTMW